MCVLNEPFRLALFSRYVDETRRTQTGSPQCFSSRPVKGISTSTRMLDCWFGVGPKHSVRRARSRVSTDSTVFCNNGSQRRAGIVPSGAAPSVGIPTVEDIDTTPVCGNPNFCGFEAQFSCLLASFYFPSNSKELECRRCVPLFLTCLHCK